MSSQTPIAIPQTPEAPPETIIEPGKAATDERYYYASQWQLIRWRFSRHKAAVVSIVLLVILYILAIFAEFFSPYTPDTRFEGYQSAPPTPIHWIKPNGGGFGPYVFDTVRELDKETFKYIYQPDETKVLPIHFFVHAEPYKLLGLIRTDIHLFGVKEGRVLLFGSDRLARDVFTRTLFGARISLSIGLVGVFISFVLGVLLGGISGYFGGVVDDVIQRVIDFLLAIPGLPLWMTLSAALPRDWPTLKLYFAITVILSILGWTGLARVVRGKMLALREEDYTLAARGAGASAWRIITRHLLPGFTSHLIVSITFNIPGMILSETALSFIGVGIQPPAVSWGTLLQDAQNLTAVAQQTWLMIPALFVIGTVLLFNFVGDGLRDAADPYAR
ncbi:MAG: Dipeptide transport system permease protein DppC [Chloroflexi bacterium ADurb.Bin325]|nr:MAG: Dipeptide transport system permease protein DppC [Chloroflexi bacterium ADurb.Bin325]